MKNYCQVWLSCADEDEAKRIAGVLLEKRLVACAKQVSVKSTFHWKSEIDDSDEILLVMDSREDLFDEIEAEVAKIHSYETFVLQSIAVSRVSEEAQKWLYGTLR